MKTDELDKTSDSIEVIPKEYIFGTLKSLIDQRNRYIVDNGLIDFRKFMFTNLVKKNNEQHCVFCGTLVSDPHQCDIRITDVNCDCNLKEIIEIIGYGIELDSGVDVKYGKFNFFKFIKIFSCDQHAIDLVKVSAAAETGKFSLDEILSRRFNPEIG